MEKEDYIWKRYCSEENKPGKKNEEYIWRRKICFWQGRRLTGKEKKENIWRRKICFLRRTKTEKEKGGNILRRKRRKIFGKILVGRRLLGEGGNNGKG